MPEIWLSYGSTEVVLDIKAENLERQVSSEGKDLSDSEIASKLQSVDLAKPTEIVILETTKAVHKAVTMLLDACIQKSLPKPKILVEKSNLHIAKNMFSDPSISISEFENSQLTNANLMFVGEMEFDGLFGFDTVSTKLLRRFGREQMLEAYEKKNGNLPHPGEDLPTLEVAKKFTDGFEISSLEVVANSTGIVDLSAGHPSSTMSLSKSLSSVASSEIGKHRILFISTGKETSNETLNRSLSSLWNCAGAVKEEGLAILLAECKNGLGSEALLQYVEGRMSLDRLKNPAKYVDGMENILFLTEIQKQFKIGIVSILPTHYTKDKLGLIPFGGTKESMDHVLKTYGERQKAAIISDGARVLLR
ncbi:MAG TPA: transcriptional regulator [Candidatus Nitrosotalea sp.]|nr:transcriptional regulator [Candidatus Nitrosotalea sp.]